VAKVAPRDGTLFCFNIFTLTMSSDKKFHKYQNDQKFIALSFWYLQVFRETKSKIAIHEKQKTGGHFPRWRLFPKVLSSIILWE